jgi:phosphoribosyl 1,2-cyclic phosphodiesterase
MSKLQFSVLASGSKGNAAAVFPDGKTGFLLDCGLSKKVLKKRLGLIGKSIDDIYRTFVTHHHGDHYNESGISATQSKGYRIPGHPYQSSNKDVFKCSGCDITPFELSHGDCPCHGFRVDYKGMSMAYLVDTEYVPEESLPYLFDLDAIIIEANYREQILRSRVDQYQYIYGDPTARHLSNEQAACILSLINSKRLKYVIMAHGSSRNSTPAFARNAGKTGAPQAQVLVAEQDRPTKMITLMS